MYLLDTNVLSELRRPAKIHPNVQTWAASVLLDELYLCTTTILEIEIGCLRLERRDTVQAKILRTWIDKSVLVRYRGRILPFDTRDAQECARLHIPDPKPDRDAMIAATAIVNGLTLVTRNTKDFDATGAKLFNPWL